MVWKKGRGRLGALAPLLGEWVVETDSERGPLVCTRRFETILGGKYVELRCTWQFGDSTYEERCLFGVNADKQLAFWSFTSDGKQAAGSQCPAQEVHPDALAFEAEMPAGTARQIYWPDAAGGFRWAVESKTKKGWKRFVEHHYEAA